MGLRRAGTVALLFILAGAAPATAQDGTEPATANEVQSRRPDYDRAMNFFHRLQSALQRNDAAAVEAMVHYPMRAWWGGHGVVVRNKANFRRQYETIFTPARKAAIVNCQDKDVWWRDQGYSIPFGVIWFDAFMPPGKQWPADSSRAWTAGTFGIETVNEGARGSEMSEAVLRAVALEKTYPPLTEGAMGLQLFRELSLEVAAGEMVAVVGESGAGKSSLLHLLAALDAPTAGEVWCGATNVTTLKGKKAAEFRNRRLGTFGSSITCCRSLRRWRMWRCRCWRGE